MRITMRTLAAGPDRVLEAGKTYNVPAEVAQPFLDATPPYAVLAKSTDKVTKLPLQPDPEDLPEQDIDEDDDE